MIHATIIVCFIYAFEYSRLAKLSLRMTTIMRMHNPPYPALTIKEDILPGFGLSVTEAAKQLGVNRVTLSNLLNGNSAISAEMALRLHAWLGKDSPSPESWLHQQASYDLWQVKQRVDFKVTPVKEAMKAQKKTRVDNP